MIRSFPYYLLPGESREEYESLAAAYEGEFSPATEHESFLVNQLVEARWKVHRYERLLAEAANQIFAAGEVKGLAPDAALVDALAQPNSAYEKLRRYIVQAERSYQRIVNQLNHARRRRVTAELDGIDAIMGVPVPPPPARKLQNEPNLQPDLAPQAARPAETEPLDEETSRGGPTGPPPPCAMAVEPVAGGSDSGSFGTQT